MLLQDVVDGEERLLAHAGARRVLADGVAHGGHAPAKTVEELLAALPPATHPGGRCKNLFIKAKKERAGAPQDSKLWLVVALVETKVDLKALATKLGYGNVQLRFAEADALLENLAVEQGHVSPLSLAHDKARVVQVALDAAMLAPGAPAPLWFHPGDNSASVGISAADLLKLLAATGHAHTVVDFSK